MTAPAGAATAASLMRMANDIAAFFHRRPAAEAAAGIAGHINDFWTPAMRRAFLAAGAAEPEALSPALRAALGLIRPGHEEALQAP